MPEFHPAPSGVFCDGLAVTFSPDDSPRDDLGLFLQAHGFDLGPGSHTSMDLWRCDQAGLVRFEAKARHHRVYASGKALGYLRARGAVLPFLSELASQPHRVTLVDVAYDRPIDGPTEVNRLLDAYPATCALTRKGIGTWSVLAAGRDGRRTGSFYVGRRGKSEVQAKVYDKQAELWDVQGVETGPTTRVEVSVRGKLGPTLRDAAEPAAMFWHFAAPALLDRPAGAPVWNPTEAASWSHERQAVTPWEALRRRVEDSADLGAIIALADRVGPQGRSELLRLLERRIGAAPAADTSPKAGSTPQA